MTTILLDGIKSNDSVDSTMNLNVNFVSTSKNLTKSNISETLDLYTLYSEEKNNCTKYKLTFSLNSVCSNILFNKKTEVVCMEGSDECFSLSDYSQYNFKDGKPSSASSELSETYDNINNRACNGHLSALTLYDAITDTEYNNKYIGNLTYHCGADICNNHILRSTDYSFINVSKQGNDVFNTLYDVLRDENGNVDKQSVYHNLGKTDCDAHVYRLDTIKTVDSTFKTKIYDKNGWVGFDNVSYLNANNIKISGDDEFLVNRVINNQSPCSFIDLYPDRTLYSFAPKFNKYRRRVEYNWDLCLTYPYKSDYEALCKINNNAPEYSIFIGNGYSFSTSNNGNDVVVFNPKYNHNLHIGRFITLYYSYTSDNGSVVYSKCDKKIQIVWVGDISGNDKYKYFSIREEDMPSEVEKRKDSSDNRGYSYYTKSEGKKVEFSYKQNINNNECKYYIRKFKPIYKNHKEIDSFVDDGVSTKPTPLLYKYDMEKLSFGTNIYGDSMGQAIFETIDVDGVKDNLGRPVSEIYLTIIKSNRGHDKWYLEDRMPVSGNNKYQNEKGSNLVEYSHCFGEITSGFEINGDYDDYNSKRLHNISISKLSNSNFAKKGDIDLVKYVDEEFESDEPGKIYPGKHDSKNNKKQSSSEIIDGTEKFFGEIEPPKTVEHDIALLRPHKENGKEYYVYELSSVTKTDESVKGANGTYSESEESNDDFYGDIVEFNPSEFTETILCSIDYRFNTAQRETLDYEYFNIFGDTINRDDFDNTAIVTNGDDDGDDSVKGFYAYTEYLNTVSYLNDDSCVDNSGNIETSKQRMAGNLTPEGYIYHPHNKIVIKELSDELSSVSTSRINIDYDDTTSNYIETFSDYDLVHLKSPRDYSFINGCIIAFYDFYNDKTYFGTVDFVSSKTNIVVRVNKNIGLYSEDSTKKKTSSVVPISDSFSVMKVNGTVPSYAIYDKKKSSIIWRPCINMTNVESGSTLYNAPFANGMIYIEKNINLFLRRQDPNNENYLYNYDEKPNNGSSASAVGRSTNFKIPGFSKLDVGYLLDTEISSLDLC